MADLQLLVGTSGDIRTHSNKRQLYWQFVWLCILYIFTAVSWSALQNLQSSLNYTAGLGDISLFVTSGTILLSCGLSPAVIRTIGEKGAIILATLGQCVYTTVNFFPTYPILLGGSALVGITTGPGLTALGTYTTTLCLEIARATGEEADAVIGRFTGIFFSTFLFGGLAGNLLSSLILHSEASNSSMSSNETYKCAMEFCPWDSADIEAKANPPHSTVIFLLSTYEGCVCVSLAISIFLLKPLHTICDGPTSPDQGGIMNGMKAFFRLFKDIDFLLCLPIFLYGGAVLAIMTSDFSEAFVTCELGIHWVGYTVIALMATSTIACLLNGFAQKWTGQYILLVVASVINAGVLVSFFYFDKLPGSPVTYMIISAIWGLADGIWNTQTTALTSVLFSDRQEAAFAQFRMWQAAGGSVYYFIAPKLCMFSKTVGFGCFLVLTFISYTALKFRTMRQRLPKT